MSKSEFPNVEVEIWFEDPVDFFIAQKQLVKLNILEQGNVASYMLLKEMTGTRLGFGFYDKEQGIMAKLAVQ